MKTYYVDGKFVAADKAVIPVNDLAVLRGYGVCDIMRTYNGKPYFLNEHVHRLKMSAEKTGLNLPWSSQDIKQIILDTLNKNNLEKEANIRIVITGGSSTDFFSPQGNPRLIILITDMNRLPDHWYKKGVKVITHPLERSLPGAKVISYIPAVLALKKAKDKGAIEAIYINRENQTLEGTTSNLFAFFNITLTTPKDGVLNGITRQAILKLANDEYPVKEAVIPLEKLLKADEVFISGTNKSIVPVIQIDNQVIGNGKPGKLTKKLILKLENHAKAFENKQ